MQSVLRFFCLVFVFCFFGGCSNGKEYRLEQEIRFLTSNVESARQDLITAQSALDSFDSDLPRKRRELSGLRAEEEFDRTVQDGSAGTTEQLLLIKRTVDNPGQSSDRQRRIVSLEVEIKSLEGAAREQSKNTREQAREAYAKLQKAQTELAEARKALRKLRRS